MKSVLLIFLICLFGSTHAQTLFSYEQKIELPENYERKEIKFGNLEDDVVLSGTLIYPNSEFNKVVIIVPGSGKDSRHSHYNLAKEFLLNQIAVFRFDERGIGKSGGKYKWSNETASQLEKDVISAFRKLKRIQMLSNKKIGILGHSLGGIASIAAFDQGCAFDFLIQMATPVENNGAFLKYQASSNTGGLYTIKNKTSDEVIQLIDSIRKAILPGEDYKTSKEKALAIIKQLNFGKAKHIINPVMIDLMKQNHEETYQSCKIPMLFIIGSEDKIVSSKNEIKTLEKLDNPNISISLINGVNHYLVDKTKLKNQNTSSIYQMSMVALNEIISWTKQL